MTKALTYNDCPQFHPMIAPLRERRFRYTWDLLPSDFRIYYHLCPVELGGGSLTTVSALRYISHPGVAAANACSAWRRAVRAHAGPGISLVLDGWLKTSRPMAVFNGHGLPEEISLVCQLALSSGYKRRDDLQAWVTEHIGLDCNGFTNAYYMSIGTFSRVMHSHPEYVRHAARAATDVEVSWDSCMVWAWGPGKDESASTGYRPRPNPGNGAHIAVVERWLEFGRTLVVVERGGTHRFKGRPPGLTRSVYTVVRKPPKGVAPSEAGWRVKSEFRRDAEDVIITKRMPVY